jgi:acetyltransferase-like isoleucine patch superfamily enzyme
MKALITLIIRLRNPGFAFSQEVDSRMVFSFLAQTGFSLLRGLRVLLLGKQPKGLLLGRGVSFRYSHKISFGKFLKLGNRVSLQALGQGGISIGNNVSIGDYGKVVVSTTLNHIGKFIRIGNNVGIGEYAYLGGAGGLTIGDDCIIGQYFSCHPENHNFQMRDTPIRHQGVSRSGIRLGKNCWVGAKVTLLDGVSVGDHSVIAAGAVVTKSFPPYSVLGGVPARVIKTRSDQATESVPSAQLTIAS